MLAQFQPQTLVWFPLAFVLALVWTVAWFAFLLRRRARFGPRFPDRAQVHIIYEEAWASGNSLKSAFTRYGGANNCLRVTVTDTELWTTMPFPFCALDQITDLAHRIDREAITHVEPLFMRRVLVAFTRDDGTPGRIILRLRKREQFLRALGVTPEQDRR